MTKFDSILEFMNEGLIFFSYSRLDDAIALRLAADLQQKQFNIWIDKFNILPADRWDLAIQKALASAEIVLFIVSGNSVVSNNVMDEVNYAIDHNIKLVPVLTQDVPLPFRASRFQWIDFTKNYDEGLQRLTDFLGSISTVQLQTDTKKTKLPEPPTRVKKEDENSKADKHSLYTRLGGALFILAALILTLVKSCPTNSQLLMIYTLIGVGLAFLLVRVTDKINFKFSVYNVSVGLTGAIALPFILYLTNPVGKFKSADCLVANPYTNVSVNVYGRAGTQDLVLRNKGFVVMILPWGDRPRKLIDDQGTAVFPHVLTGTKVKFDIDYTEPYHPSNGDSMYTIRPDTAIGLQVLLKGADLIQGTIISADSALPGVTVTVDALMTTTNNTGHYEIHIPANKQKDSYILWFNKPGFKTVSTTAYPQTGTDVDLVMETLKPANVKRK